MIDWTQLPYWAMAICCVYTIYSLKKRDDVIDRIADTVFGSEKNEGLKSRMNSLENTIDRCQGCTPGDHHTGGNRWYDPAKRLHKAQCSDECDG